SVRRRRSGEEANPLGGGPELAVPGGLPAHPARLALQRALRVPDPRPHAGGGEGQRRRAGAAVRGAGPGRMVQGDRDGGARLETAGALEGRRGGEDLASGDTAGTRETGNGKSGQAATRSGAGHGRACLRSSLVAHAPELLEPGYRV